MGSNYSILPKIAKEAIKAKLEGRELDKEALRKKYPFLNKSGAVFVTIEKNHNLRGCIGSIIAHRSLLDDVIINAKSAAFRDPRFPSLTKEEFDEIEVEVSILTPPQLVEYQDVEDLKRKIKKNVDGVILKYNGFQATFLPQVWNQLPNFDDFFSQLGLKAGIGIDPLKLHPTIYKYQVNLIK